MTNKTEAFKRDCRILRMKQEYPGYTGDILWIVISDLSEKQIIDTYVKRHDDHIMAAAMGGTA